MYYEQRSPMICQSTPEIFTACGGLRPTDSIPLAHSAIKIYTTPHDPFNLPRTARSHHWTIVPHILCYNNSQRPKTA